MAKNKNADTGGNITFGIASIFLLGFTGLFAWQTWQFVDWLFPSDAVFMKILTLLSFDVMLLVYGMLDLFYRFVTKLSHNLIKIGWSVAGVLSVATTILFFVISSMLRFQVAITPALVDWGYVIVTISVVANMIILTFWWRIEWTTRHPRSYEYETEEEDDEEEPQVFIREVKPQSSTNKRALARVETATHSEERTTNKPADTEDLSTNKPESGTNKKKLPRLVAKSQTTK